MNIPLLQHLREARGDFIPVADLGADVVAVHAALDELEQFGFAIERHPYRGVAYRGPAERLCPDLIEHDLGTIRVGRRIAVWNRVTSTNDLAARAAGSSANEGLVVLAESQSAGRGRRGRNWSAPGGSSILMSVLMFPPDRLAETAWLTALGAVAAAEVVSAWTGREARIKWPNDVRVDGRKIAGVLVERGLGAVVGVGLNANITAADFPEALRESATSLQMLMQEPVDRSELARALIRALDRWYDLGVTIGPDSLNAPWRDRCEQIGRRVRIETPAGTLTGRLADIDLASGLTLEGDRSQGRRIACREVLALSALDDSDG